MSNLLKRELHIVTHTDPAPRHVADTLLWMNMIDEGLRADTVPDHIIASALHKPCDGTTTIVMATDGVVLPDHAWRTILLPHDAHMMTLTRHRHHPPLGIMMIHTSQVDHMDVRAARREVTTEATNDARTGSE